MNIILLIAMLVIPIVLSVISFIMEKNTCNSFSEKIAISFCVYMLSLAATGATGFLTIILIDKICNL